ncbi:MAG: DUF4139 domain-containing protein [Candidatus Methanoplasma sp.]|jgi:uncharacterized protein (TIGR02231 family)|nr:DUF4139 domain-containing protein [Candidatus Methanoplasma sp.]
MGEIKNSVSSVEEVKVFLNGAEIKRRAGFDAVTGRNTVVFAGLPQDVRPESVSASVESGGKLISVDFSADSFTEPAVSTKLRDLKERHDQITDKIKRTENSLNLLRSEEKFLDRNRKVGGDSGSDIEVLKEMEKYHRDRKTEIYSSREKTETELEELTEERERIAKEMGSFSSGSVRYAGRIDTEFFSEAGGPAEITVSYYTGSARWKPLHELRMTDTDAPVTLSMKAEIFQNTGEDWNRAKIKLSTGNPMLGNEQPALYPWRIDLVTPRNTRVSANGRFMDMDAVLEEKDMEVSVPMFMMQSVAVEETHTAVEFFLPAGTEIESSSKPSRVEISKHVLGAEFYYYCVAKLDTDVFLIANISGWESLNILAGEVSIFQGNEYVGRTHIDPRNMDGDMQISLGRDKAVIVKREKGLSTVSKSMLGKNTKAVREWITTVRNTRSKGIKIRLADQIPISANSAVTVDAAELSGADLDGDTGILTWSMDIGSGEAAKKVLRYEVSYPKNGTVRLD